MTHAVKAVLDSSALLAYLRREPGYDAVIEALIAGAAISAVNWAETLSKLADLGRVPHETASALETAGLLGQSLQVRDFTDELAREAATLRAATRGAGLSIGDRACLALGRTLKLPILTTDRLWREVKTGAQVRLIR